MKKTEIKIRILIFSVLAVIIIIPSTGFAQDRGHDKSEHRGHRDKVVVKKEKVVVRHDDSYKEVVVKDRHVFYRGGAFYEKRPNGYVVVQAPVGARIDVLPGGYKIIRHNRLKYYLFGGIYYRFLPRERVYVVVSAPF